MEVLYEKSSWRTRHEVVRAWLTAGVAANFPGVLLAARGMLML